MHDKAVNAGFSGSKPGQWKKPFKANRDGPSNLDKILDRPCQIHGTPDKPATHTNRSCSVFKQASKLNAEHKGKGPPSDSDDEETRQPNTGGQKQFPPEVKTVKMVYVTHTPTGERRRALRDAYAIEPLPPKFSHIRPEGSAALIIDPIIDGFDLTKVLMDGDSSLNLLYQDTVCKMGIDPSRIKPTTATLKGTVFSVSDHRTTSEAKA